MLNNFLNESFTALLGAIVRGWCVAGIQVAESARSQMDDSPLFAFQGGVGLDYSTARNVHGNLHSVRGCISSQRAEYETQERQAQRYVWRRSHCDSWLDRWDLNHFQCGFVRWQKKNDLIELILFDQSWPKRSCRLRIVGKFTLIISLVSIHSSLFYCPIDR